jgi:hypothetical protein
MTKLPKLKIFNNTTNAVFYNSKLNDQGKSFQDLECYLGQKHA